MKYSLLFLLLTLFLVSCTTKKEVGGIVVDRIQYDVRVNNKNPDLNWWVNNIEGSARESLLSTIYDQARSGKVDAYDYFYEKLTLEEVANIGTDTIYQTLMRTTEPYDEYDTMVIERISYRDITLIRFMEEWIVDDETLEVKKNVVGMAPVYERGFANEVYTQVMFWVFFDKRYPAILKDR
jgi:hypothetical protein